MDDESQAPPQTVAPSQEGGADDASFASYDDYLARLAEKRGSSISFNFWESQ